ncbi:MAG: low temperature requirement protein A, partial [Myxococcales bacterium]|nr:low temperature requirement protein A [Myxococcales bacterium]
MRSRWFHVPRLHLPSMGAARAGGLGDASALSMTAGMGSKGTSWLAIFYDLVVAAAIARLGEALAGSLAQGEGLFGVAQVAGYFVPFWLAWTGFTFFEGRFTVDDFVQRTVVFLQMVALVAMGATVPS